jgi:hypothetical protein
MDARSDEGIIAKIATNVSRNYFSVDAIAIYEKLSLALTSLLTRR